MVEHRQLVNQLRVNMCHKKLLWRTLIALVHCDQLSMIDHYFPGVSTFSSRKLCPRRGHTTRHAAMPARTGCKTLSRHFSIYHFSYSSDGSTKTQRSLLPLLLSFSSGRSYEFATRDERPFPSIIRIFPTSCGGSGCFLRKNADNWKPGNATTGHLRIFLYPECRLLHVPSSVAASPHTYAAYMCFLPVFGLFAQNSVFFVNLPTRTAAPCPSPVSTPLFQAHPSAPSQRCNQRSLSLLTAPFYSIPSW